MGDGPRGGPPHVNALSRCQGRVPVRKWSSAVARGHDNALSRCQGRALSRCQGRAGPRRPCFRASWCFSLYSSVHQARTMLYSVQELRRGLPMRGCASVGKHETDAAARIVANAWASVPLSSQRPRPLPLALALAPSFHTPPRPPAPTASLCLPFSHSAPFPPGLACQHSPTDHDTKCSRRLRRAVCAERPCTGSHPLVNGARTGSQPPADVPPTPSPGPGPLSGVKTGPPPWVPVLTPILGVKIRPRKVQTKG